MGEDPIENMRARAEQCRRLSDHIHDRDMAEQLRTWAAEIDADIRRLEQDRKPPVPTGSSSSSREA